MYLRIVQNGTKGRNQQIQNSRVKFYRNVILEASLKPNCSWRDLSALSVVNFKHLMKELSEFKSCMVFNKLRRIITFAIVKLILKVINNKVYILTDFW